MVASAIIQAVAKSTAKRIDVTCPVIKWTKAKFGKCVPDRNTIYIPCYAAKVGVGFLVYYAVHETCHLKTLKHDNSFKTFEQLALKPFDLTIEYDGDYPNILLWRGLPVFRKGGKAWSLYKQLLV